MSGTLRVCHYDEFGFELHFRDHVLHLPTATAENLVEGGTGVGRHLKPIGDLDRIRCA